MKMIPGIRNFRDRVSEKCVRHSRLGFESKGKLHADAFDVTAVGNGHIRALSSMRRSDAHQAGRASSGDPNKGEAHLRVRGMRPRPSLYDRVAGTTHHAADAKKASIGSAVLSEFSWPATVSLRLRARRVS
jgi:hypothetical protein